MIQTSETGMAQRLDKLVDPVDHVQEKREDGGAESKSLPVAVLAKH